MWPMGEPTGHPIATSRNHYAHPAATPLAHVVNWRSAVTSGAWAASRDVENHAHAMEERLCDWDGC